jgi:uroporphyrinogen decarboxylase
MSGRLVRALRQEALDVPPIWMMRQAGRYQQSYQRLRERHSFEDMCRIPELSATVALNAVDEFDFDAAILFSDLLFPLEAMGFTLGYPKGAPEIGEELTPEFLATLKPAAEALPALKFQHDALAATRAKLDRSKDLIGFVGGPWTLFKYARGPLPLYRSFAAHILPLLIEMIRQQFDAGAELIMVFDTSAGELSPEAFQQTVASDLSTIAAAFPQRLGYYALGWSPAHAPSAEWKHDRAGFGVDWRWDLPVALRTRANGTFLQGNFDPTLLTHSGAGLDESIARFVQPFKALGEDGRRGWVCGLGHGVLPVTPEASVRTFVNSIRKEFA